MNQQLIKRRVVIFSVAIVILVVGSFWGAGAWKRATTWEEYELVIDDSEADRLLDGWSIREIDTDDLEKLFLTKLPPGTQRTEVQAFVTRNFRDANPVVKTDGLPPEIGGANNRFIRATGFVEGSIYGSNRMELYFLISDEDTLQTVRAHRISVTL